MNGARPVPERITSRPKISSVMRIGTSHHFLFSRRNPQNSPRNPPRACSLAAFSKSLCCGLLMVRLDQGLILAEIAADVTRSFFKHPETRLACSRSFAVKQITTAQAKED